MIFFHLYQNIAHPKIESLEFLKTNLAHYLNKPINKINIMRNDNGKPYINDLFFSVSHSQDTVVQTFTTLGDIGTDIEYKNPKRNYLDLAKRFFHQDEYKYLKNLDPSHKLNEFYNLWTRKESVCKAKGGRLWYYLNENYINENNTMKNIIRGLQLIKPNPISQYSVSIALESLELEVEIKYV